MRISRRRVEVRRDPPHPLALGGPVAEHRAVEELREGIATEPCLLRERRGRVLAHDPGHVVIHHACGGGPVGGLQRHHPLGVELGGGARVVRSRNEDQRVDGLDLVAEQRSRAGHELERRSLDPAQRLGEKSLEGDTQERVRAAPRHRPADLLEERPGLRVASDAHLPAGLDAEAVVDDQLGVGAVAWVGHRLHANAARAPWRTTSA